MQYYFGNAADDGQDDRGWFLGYFMRGRRSELYSNDVELKWSTHQRGEGGDHPVSETNVSTSVCILIAGEMHLVFGVETVKMSTLGDYVKWGPGVPHAWMAAENETTVITVRWPSAKPE